MRRRRRISHKDWGGANEATRGDYGDESSPSELALLLPLRLLFAVAVGDGDGDEDSKSSSRVDESGEQKSNVSSVEAHAVEKLPISSIPWPSTPPVQSAPTFAPSSETCARRAIVRGRTLAHNAHRHAHTHAPRDSRARIRTPMHACEQSH